MSSVISYLRQGNVSTRPMTVRFAPEGATTASIRLQGRPAVLTREAVARLAASQEGTVKGTVRTKDAESGQSYSDPLEVSAERAANAILGNVEEQQRRRRGGKATGDTATEEHAREGEPSANGQAS